MCGTRLHGCTLSVSPNVHRTAAHNDQTLLTAEPVQKSNPTTEAPRPEHSLPCLCFAWHTVLCTSIHPNYTANQSTNTDPPPPPTRMNSTENSVATQSSALTHTPGDATRSTPPVLQAHNLLKSYPEAGQTRHVLNNLSITLMSGDFVVLLGRSGSGKSTLLNLLSGIDLPDEGSILLDGREVSALGEHERTLFRRQHLGFVFQSYNLIPTLTVLENVLLPMEMKGWNEMLRMQRAKSYLQEVALGDRTDAFPDRLSGGEQQRVAIARALAHEPRLILADEPTGNLDEQTARQVSELFHRLARKTRSTVLIATHDRDMHRYADRVYLVQGGTLQLLPHPNH